MAALEKCLFVISALMCYQSPSSPEIHNSVAPMIGMFMKCQGISGPESFLALLTGN